MEIIIRFATPSDLKEVQRLNLKLFEKEKKEFDPLLDPDWVFGEKGTEYFSKRIAEHDDCVLIAMEEKKVVGYLCGTCKLGEEYRRLPPFAELENMMVLEEYQSKGI